MLVSSLNVLGHAACKFPSPAVSKPGPTSSDRVPADSDDDGTETEYDKAAPGAHPRNFSSAPSRFIESIAL